MTALADLDPVGMVEIAERLGVPQATVATWRHRGLLPAAEAIVGGRPCWAWATVQSWAEANGRAS